MKEAIITINGQLITDAMSMTLRVALEGFASDLSHNGLGEDDLGMEMVKLYRARISEIRSLMYVQNGNNPVTATRKRL